MYMCSQGIFRKTQTIYKRFTNIHVCMYVRINNLNWQQISLENVSNRLKYRIYLERSLSLTRELVLPGQLFLIKSGFFQIPTVVQN